MADRVGQQLGHYRLIRLLGRGGFAEVYLGEHLRLNNQVAVKILHTSLEDDDVAGFLREAQTVARLKHPHIVRVFDFDVENHAPYLVMDYLPNGNVRRSYPKGSPLPLTTIVSYVKQGASALQYAHGQKLIHRDVKPENMLLDQDNTIVLSDFGIALMAQSSRYQSTQEVAGTAAYMAPNSFRVTRIVPVTSMHWVWWSTNGSLEIVPFMARSPRLLASTYLFPLRRYVKRCR